MGVGVAQILTLGKFCIEGWAALLIVQSFSVENLG